MHPVDVFVTPGGLHVDPAAVTWTSTRSGGPGGQHANTSDTAVTMTVELALSGLPPYLVERLTGALGPTVTTRATDSRSQWRNRALAWQRLAHRLDVAARPPMPRQPTRPTRTAVRTRLDDKRRHSDVKRARRRPRREPGDD
jgi:ribosome-associated protein